METILENKIERAKELARARDATAAARLADELTTSHPEDIRVWILRGHFNELFDDYAAAVKDLTRAMDLTSDEPHLFFTRGRYRFHLDDHEGALDDFASGLKLCDRLNNDYYREAFHFWRAESFIRLGKLHDALQDLSHVGDDQRWWTYKLRTKQDLLRDCRFVES